MSLLYEKVVQEDLDTGTSTATVTSPSGGSLTGTQIGIHSFAQGQVQAITTWNPSSIAAAGYEAKDITVPGAALGDFTMVKLSSLTTDDLTLTGHVSAPDTVTAILFNPTTAAVNLGSGSLGALVFKAR